MSRIILNQIALQKIKVISETKKYFLLQPSSAAAPNTSNYGITPPTYTQTGYSGWSDTEPSYIVGDDRVLYELTETIYSDRTWDYSTPTISSSYKAAKEAYNEAIQAEEDIQDFVDLGLKQGYIWDNPTSKPASGTIPVYPAGSYIASGILSGGTRSINRSNSNTYGLNTWISTGGINLRYNAIDLMKLTTSNLFFYYPSTSTQQKKAISLGTNGAVNSLAFYGFNNDNKTMELTNNALTFYNPSNGTDELATLNADGLVLSKGGIIVNTVGSNNGVYISSENLGSVIPSLVPTPSSGTPKTNWRAIIGSKFGVDSEGNLYANEAHISGQIIVGSGSDLSAGLSNYSTTSDMTTAISTATGTKADKTAALSRSQRIYYRSTSIQNLDSFSGPTTWLSTSGTGYENWSLSIPQLTNGEDSYPYLYTCVQNQTAAQYAAGSVCTCTPVVSDDSTTVIDGGNITTGQILASYIETAGLSINSTQVDDLDDLLDTKQNVGDYITDSDFDERISNIAATVNTLNGQILFGDDGRNTFILLQNRSVIDNTKPVTGVQAKLTSEKLAFGTFGSVDNEVAYFSSEELKVQKRLSFGNFVMKQRDNGHLSIMYEGGDD